MKYNKGNRICHEGGCEVKESFKEEVKFEQTLEGSEEQITGYLGEVGS